MAGSGAEAGAVDLRVLVLGAPRVERGANREAVEFATQKGAALLYLLASRPDTPVSRGQVISLLWEDSSEQEGRNSLSTALSRLRRTLPELPVVARGDALVWAPEPAFSAPVDAADFARLTAPSARLDDLDAAAGLYRGPFLDGLDLRDCPAWEEWLAAERGIWQQRALDVLERAAELHAARSDWQAAAGLARRGLAIDPLQERFNRLLMRSLHNAGERAAALAHYRAAARLLEEQLGVSPDAETQALYRSLLTDSAPTPPQSRAPVERRPPAARPPIRLVGRTAELASLREAASRVDSGQGGFWVVEGEAGIGKTRLTEELVWQLDGEEARALGVGPAWLVLAGPSHESEHSLPYNPFVSLLADALASGVNGWLDSLSDVWLAEVARLAPELLELRPNLPVPTRIDPQQEQRRLFEGVARFLAALPRPRLLLLQDLQWADDGSLQLLGYLVRHPMMQGTLILATVRTEDTREPLAALLRELAREHHVERMRLGRLSQTATVELVQQLVQADVQLLGSQLHRETEGNPLFAVETVRALLDSGHAVLGGGSIADGTPLPDSIQAVIRSRLARLEPDALGFANAMAVLTGAVDFEQARAISGQDEDTALEALEQLLRMQLVRELSGASGEPLYAFSHDKIRQVLYEDLSGARRRVLHRRALDLLAQAGAAAGERLAYHATRAQAWEAAVRWSTEAADSALALFAYSAAAMLYEQALASLQQLPSSPELRAQGVLLRLKLAHVAFYASPGRLGEWLVPAEAEAQALGDPGLLAAVWLAEAAALYIQGRLSEALPLLDRIEPATRDNPQLRAQYLSNLGQVLALRGEYNRAVPALREALTLLGPEPSIESTVCAEMLGAVYAYMGDFDRAAVLLGETHELTQLREDQAALAASHGFLAAAAQMRGDWPTARRYGLQAVATAREAGNVVHEYVGLVFLGLPQSRDGDPEEGAATLRRAIGIATAAGTMVLLGRANAWLAEVELARGDAQAALTAALTGLDAARTYGYLFDEGVAERAIGEAQTALGDLEPAGEHLARSRDVLATIGALPELTRTLAATARWAAAAGQQDMATQAAVEAEQRASGLGLADISGRFPTQQP